MDLVLTVSSGNKDTNLDLEVQIQTGSGAAGSWVEARKVFWWWGETRQV